MTIKHYLIPNGIDHSVYPSDRPDFNAWSQEIHKKPEVHVEEKEVADKGTEREINHLFI